MNLDAAKGGQEYPPIYEHPYWWAKRFGELEQFHASYTQNVACATAINLTLAKHYDFDTGHPNIAPAAKEIVDKFGFDRTMYVLASTVWDYAWDDNISPSSKEWARTIPCYDEPDISRGYSVSGNTDVIDRLISQVRHDYSLFQAPKAQELHGPSIPQDWTGMSEEALHMALLEKMEEEQSAFRAQLLNETPEEILGHAFEHSAREEILSMMQWRTLDGPSYMALLDAPSALDTLYAQYHDMDVERQDFLRECIDTKVRFMVEDQEDLAREQAETGARKSSQHKPSVLSRLAVPSVPGEESTGKVKKEAVR